MLRFQLVCLVMTFFGILSAQKIIHEVPVGWNGSGIELNTIQDKYGSRHATFLLNDDSIRVYFLNQHDSIENVFNISRIYGEKIRGGFIDLHKIYLFCIYKIPHLPRIVLHNYVFNLDDGKISQKSIESAPSKTLSIDRISAGDHFLNFSVDKKKSEFIFYDWRNQDSSENFNYLYTDKITWEDISDTRDAFSSDLNISKVEGSALPGAETARKQNKLYLIHDSLFLLLNKNDGITKIFAFDSKGKQGSYREIKNEPVKKVVTYTNTDRDNSRVTEETRGYVDNSYLLDGKLYYVSASHERLNISITDFFTGIELQKFTLGMEDSISFINTPILQEGDIYGFDVTKELSKTKQLLRKMVAGYLVITAVYEGPGVALTIGSDKLIYHPDGHGFNTISTKSIRFRMLLDSTTLRQIPGELQMSIIDRVEEFMKGVNIAGGAENLFLQEGKYIFIYYDKKRQSLAFARF
jgi:hypothetical protein